MEEKLPEEISLLTSGKSYTVSDIGMSGGRVYMYEDMVLKTEECYPWVERSIKMMEWLADKAPVPKVLSHCVNEGRSFLLMSRVSGQMACSESCLNDPQRLIGLLAGAVKTLWSIDISDRPSVRDLETELKEARSNVENGRVNIQNTQPETFGEGGFESPATLLRWLEENRPDPDPVFTHGDLCLPNIFFDGDRLSGFIDLGDAGVGDRWRDLALLHRSLRHNTDGTFGKVVEGVDPDRVFEELDIRPDWEKLRYYTLLDELF